MKKYIISVITICCLIAVGVSWIKNRGDAYRPLVGNKSLPRIDSYTKENIEENMKKLYSFSIDDFIEACEDITKHETDYNSLFENKTFLQIKKCMINLV